jgi:hypothetical protein
MDHFLTIACAAKVRDHNRHEIEDAKALRRATRGMTAGEMVVFEAAAEVASLTRSDAGARAVLGLRNAEAAAARRAGNAEAARSILSAAMRQLNATRAALRRAHAALAAAQAALPISAAAPLSLAA